jgi:hypothetical protein
LKEAEQGMADDICFNKHQAEVVDILFAGLDLSPQQKTPITKSPPQPGDHLAVKFKLTENTYAWHHGIYMGNENVIDHSKKRGLIQRPYSEFGDSEFMVFVIEYGESTADAAVRRCNALRLASWALANADKLPYKLLENNCECFATWCSTGRYVSISTNMLHVVPSKFYEEKSRVLLQSIFRADPYSFTSHS